MNAANATEKWEQAAVWLLEKAVPSVTGAMSQIQIRML